MGSPDTPTPNGSGQTARKIGDAYKKIDATLEPYDEARKWYGRVDFAHKMLPLLKPLVATAASFICAFLIWLADTAVSFLNILVVTAP
jgi:hypothetical protein